MRRQHDDDAHEPRGSGGGDATTDTDAPATPFEGSREWSLVLASGLVISVRARWYDVNVEGWAPDQQLIYDRMDAQDTPQETP